MSKKPIAYSTIDFLNNCDYSIYSESNNKLILLATATDYNKYNTLLTKPTGNKAVNKLLLEINFVYINDENIQNKLIYNNNHNIQYSIDSETDITTRFNVQKEFYSKSSMLSDNYDALCFPVISFHKSYDTSPSPFFEKLTKYLVDHFNNQLINETKYTVIVMEEYPEGYNELTHDYLQNLDEDSQNNLLFLYLAEAILFTVLTGYVIDFNIHYCMINMKNPSQYTYKSYNNDNTFNIMNMSIMLNNFKILLKISEENWKIIQELYKTKKYNIIVQGFAEIDNYGILKNTYKKYNKILNHDIHFVIKQIINTEQLKNKYKDNTIYQLIHQDYSENEKECLHTCNNNFKYKKMCETNINNITGTCWYSSILSILLFSDKIGEEFQKKLFTLSENDIDQKIEKIKIEENDYNLIKGFNELNNTKPVLISIKNRLCKKKCEIDLDLEEEIMCGLIHMKARYNQTIDISNMLDGIIKIFNTLMYITIDKIPNISELGNDINNISFSNEENVVGYFIFFENHKVAIFKCEDKYVSNEITMNNILLNNTDFKDVIYKYIKHRENDKVKYELRNILEISIVNNKQYAQKDDKDILMQNILLKMEKDLYNKTDKNYKNDKNNICKLLFYDNDEVIIYSDETLLMHVLSSNRIQNKKKYIGLIFDCLETNNSDNIRKYILYECGLEYNKKTIISYCKDKNINIYDFVDKNKHKNIYNILNKIVTVGGRKNNKIRTKKNKIRTKKNKRKSSRILSKL